MFFSFRENAIEFYIVISEDRSGIRFRLQVLVTDVSTCSPIPNAAVTLWHCDALGLYSHYILASQNQPNAQNDNQTFLRGTPSFQYSLQSFLLYK